MLKDMGVENVEDYSVIFPEGNEENHEESRDGRYSVFDLETSPLWCMSANYAVA
jgi:hypothetical protein